MSRQTWAVLKATLNSSFGLSALRWRYLRRRERLWEPILIAWGIGTAVVFFGYAAYRLFLAMASVGAMLGQPELALGVATVFSQVLVLLMGFFFVVSSFYFSRDIPILVPLPLSPGAIITAKFVTIVAGELITISFIYWPAVIAYARYADFGAGKMLMSVIVFLMLPVLPLAITALAAMTLMRSVNRRHRDLLFYAGSLLFLGLLFAWQMSVSRVPSDNLQEYLETILTARLGLVRTFAARFPPALWATTAVHGWPAMDGVTGLGLTAATAAAAIAVLRTAGERLFYRGLIGGEEVARGGRSRNQRRRAMASRQSAAGTGAAVTAGLLAPARTPLRALVAREWMLLLRTPAWVLNNLLPGLIVPLFVFVPLLAAGQGKLQADLAGLVGGPQGMTIIGLILAAFVLFIGSVSGVAATAVSREGARIWISRVMPQAGGIQVKAKLVMSMTAVAVSAVPSVLFFALVLRIPLLYLVLPAVTGLVGSLAGMAVGLGVDMRRPMLKWKDPAEPVKRNLNALASQGLGVAIIAAGVPLARIMLKANWGVWLVHGIFLAAAGGLALAAVQKLLAQADTLFGRLEI